MYESRSLFTQANFLLLHHLRLVEVGHSILDVCIFLWIGLAGAVGFEELLDAGVSRVDIATTLLNNTILSLNFFEQVRYFGRQVCD